MVEYLLERGADIEARDTVSDVIIDIQLVHIMFYISVNVSEWKRPVDNCRRGRLFPFA